MYTRKILFFSLAVAVLAALFLWRHPPVPTRPGFRLVPREDLPGPLVPGGLRGTEQAVTSALEYLDTLEPGRTFNLGDRRVTARRLRRTLGIFLELLHSAPSPEELKQEILERFDVMEVGRGRGNGGSPPVLVTGYFQPVLRACRTKTPVFRYPVYGVPRDLVRVRLSRFDSRLPDRVIWGRVEGRSLVPYYTRRDIDLGAVRLDAPVLAYLASPVDVFMLQVQGSGVLEFQGGERRFIHYAASNGMPYRSMGRWLIERGILKEEQADWPGIRQWARENPGAFEKASAENPRYVFFRWEERGPVGSMGAVLTPFVSVALDPEVYPLSLLCLLDVPLPGAEGMQRFSGIVLNQDTGSAIGGPFRLDLYCGQGKDAGALAGRLRHRGRLFILLARE